MTGWPNLVSNSLVEDYFIRAGNRSGGANGFALGAIMAVIYFYNRNNLAYHAESVAVADGYTKTATITFFFDYFWHYLQLETLLPDAYLFNLL